MKINQNRPDTQKVPVNVINTLVEQISDLQTDVATLQGDVEGLEQSVDTVNIEATEAQINRINATNISSTNATINTITASNKVDTANLDANQAEVDTATIGTETVSSSTITDATITTANITDLDAVNGAVQHLSAGMVTANVVGADNLYISGNITNNGIYDGKYVNVVNVTAANHVTTPVLNVIDTANIRDLNISGHITGVSDIVADSIIIEETKSEVAQIDEIENRITYTDTLHPITPSPSLDNNDTYTIELPQFTGTFILRWFYDNAERWSATVIGSGKNYAITFASHYEDVGYVLKLFQWDNKLYIRHNANGVLYYSCNTDKKPDDINIYYNMVGWANPKSLEELCDETHEIDIIRPSGTVMLGAVTVPMLETFNDTFGITFKGSCTFAEMPSLDDAMVGDVWNITTEGYTDSDFVEGSSKPINAGDDIIAILDKSDPENNVLKWDKFAAGVNYDNFQAYDITATHALKSEGTLEVDGNTVLHNTTVTGNITQTGNQNVTGNETIIGKVTIGDLD